ncbi:MAG: DUF4360 domain-containing protein [Candidatus Electrothrix sp. AU1_5]|nr:DUF4360 domain-containing protein [Candidatus Electrothrix gigas]
MKIFKSVFTVVAVATCTFIASQAFARPPVYFEAPIKFRGTGCPGPNSVTVSGAGTDTLTVLFDQYDAAKPTRNAASKMMRTACSFVVPVRVPNGIQVSHLTADWRGYAEGRTSLHREYFIAGEKQNVPNEKPKGDYTVRDNLAHATWASSCNGGVFPMRINSSVRAMSQPSYIAVDTVDLKNKIVFQVKWRRCR